MSINYFLTPYHPDNNEIENTYFKIDVPNYKQKLIEQWQGIEFHNSLPGRELIYWSLPDIDGNAGLLCTLQIDYQTISFGSSHNAGEFIYWHRQYVDSQHKLYLYNDVTDNVAHITIKMSPDEIQKLVLLTSM